MTAVNGNKGKGDDEVRTPIEQPNNLNSNTKAFIDYVISEGVIEGLVNGGQSIFIDSTPLLDSDDEYNFKGVVWDERLGYADQDHIGNFDAIARENGIGAQLFYNQPQTRHIDDTDLDAVVIKIRIPALVKYVTSGSNAGDRIRTSVSHKIEVKPSDGVGTG